MFKVGEKVRVKEGSQYGQDFRFPLWGKDRTVFTIEKISRDRDTTITLVAPGYGLIGKDPSQYGNGTVSVFSDDSLESVEFPAKTDTRPSTVIKKKIEEMGGEITSRQIKGVLEYLDEEWEKVHQQHTNNGVSCSECRLNGFKEKI